MRRFGQVFLVVLMMFSLSGVLDLVLPEPCSVTESASGDEDGACPSTCVRCTCCAQSIEVVSVRLASVWMPNVADVVPAFELVPNGTAAEILHVPRALAL